METSPSPFSSTSSFLFEFYFSAKCCCFSITWLYMLWLWTLLSIPLSSRLFHKVLWPEPSVSSIVFAVCHFPRLIHWNSSICHQRILSCHPKFLWLFLSWNNSPPLHLRTHLWPHYSTVRFDIWMEFSPLSEPLQRAFTIQHYYSQTLLSTNTALVLSLSLLLFLMQKWHQKISLYQLLLFSCV